uniref:Uncharacterized protein n=1 Tax=Plectus sambesii TaxID=2011161 RepID=A0A914VL26_9BILA
MKMCMELVLRYMNGPTTSILEVMSNRTFQLPKSTLCLSNFAFEFEDLKVRNISLNETQYQDAVQDYFSNVKPTKAEFLEDFVLWPNSIFWVIQKYLHIMIHAESVHKYEASNAFPLPDHYGSYRNVTPSSDDSWQAALLLEKYIKALNVSVTEMRQTLGMALKDKFKLTIDFHPALAKKQSIEDIETAYIDWWWTCYVVDFPRLGIKLSSATEFIEIATNVSMEYSKPVVQKGYATIVLDLKNSYNFEAQWDSDDATAGVMHGALGTATAYTIRATAAYHSLPEKHSEKQCYESSTQEQCRWQCRRNMIKNLCGCTAATLPTNFTSNTNNATEECTMQRYTQCKLKYSFGDDRNCVETCLQSCDRWNYDIQHYGKNNDDVKRADMERNQQFGSMRLMVKDFDYPDFKEQYVYSVEHFNATFGGTLGIWLALDFIILIRLIIYVLTSVYNVVKVGKKYQTKPRPMNNEDNDSLTTVDIVPQCNHCNNDRRVSLTMISVS